MSFRTGPPPPVPARPDKRNATISRPNLSGSPLPPPSGGGHSLSAGRVLPSTPSRPPYSTAHPPRPGSPPLPSSSAIPFTSQRPAPSVPQRLSTSISSNGEQTYSLSSSLPSFNAFPSSPPASSGAPMPLQRAGTVILSRNSNSPVSPPGGGGGGTVILQKKRPIPPTPTTPLPPAPSTPLPPVPREAASPITENVMTTPEEGEESPSGRRNSLHRHVTLGGLTRSSHFPLRKKKTKEFSSTASASEQQEGLTSSGRISLSSMLGSSSSSLSPPTSPTSSRPASEHSSNGNSTNSSFESLDGSDSTPQPIATLPPSSGPDVHKTISHKLDDDEKRANIVLEIMHTEQTYINNMRQMLKNYKGPLKTLAMTSEEVDIEDIKHMFSNVHLILPLNEELLTNIQQRVDSWSPTQKLGDVFLRMAPFLKMYNEYGNNYKYALSLYNKYVAECPKFVETLGLCKAACKPPTNLESYMINPIQRIPRYNLLLEDLLRHTDPTHPDHADLTQAVGVMKEVANHINISVKKTENLRKLAQASTKGAGFRGLMKAHRQLIRDGMLHVLTINHENIVGLHDSAASTKERLHFFLFNDILVFAQKSDVKKQIDMTKLNSQWPLNLVWLTITSNTFELQGPTKSFTIMNCPPDEQQLWVKDIKKCLADKGSDGPNREGEFRFSGGVYDGQWYNGKIHGEGTYNFFGSQYVGQWAMGCKSGKGTYTYTTGDVYEGQWSNDLQHGSGVMRYVDGSVYTGEWFEGTKHGHGEFIYANGNKYVGGWKEDLCSGVGTLTFTSGLSYEGMWAAGKFHGKGTLKLPSGKIYVGEFLNGLRDGNGIMDWGNGERYEGTWKQGKQHGMGEWTSKDGWGVHYKGQWSLGKKEGQGIMAYQDKSRYEGQWKNDKPHGKGTMYYANGHKYTGGFKYGRPHGPGSYIYDNATLEVSGKFVGGLRDGKVNLTRIVPSEEKEQLEENMLGVGMAKLSGTANSRDSRIVCGHDGLSVDILLPPDAPFFDLEDL
ncbi:Rho guanine nucleotide exchange factor (GEF) 17 [Balamuthia mandrillaris]